jgi:hypothetical protein
LDAAPAQASIRAILLESLAGAAFASVFLTKTVTNRFEAKSKTPDSPRAQMTATAVRRGNSS